MFHAQRGIQEFSYDISRVEKIQEIELGNNMENDFNYLFENCIIQVADTFNTSNQTNYKNIWKGPEYDPLFIDPYEEYNYQLDTLRMQTGILLSQQDIFQGTLLENITMGNQEISPHHVLKLAEKMGLKKFLSENKKVSWIANAFMKRSNPNKNGRTVTADINFERLKYKGFANYIWKSIQSGVVNSIMPFGKRRKTKNGPQKE